jgi:hypothetical protein
MILIATPARSMSASFVSMQARSILGWISAIVAGRMETIALGTALSASKTGAQEEMHRDSKQQRKNTKPDHQLTGHVLSTLSFGSFTVTSS